MATSAAVAASSGAMASACVILPAPGGGSVTIDLGSSGLVFGSSGVDLGSLFGSLNLGSSSGSTLGGGNGGGGGGNNGGHNGGGGGGNN